VTVEPERRVSLEEYLELERASEEKHEFVEGEVFAMGGASPRHNSIVGNVLAELHQQLRAGPCRVFPSDLRVQVGRHRHFTYPDVTVVCDDLELDPEGTDAVVNPTVIVEVLSESTEAYDRGAKFARYRQIPSLAEVVSVAQDRVSVEHHARQPDGHWLTTYAEDLESSLPLPVLGCELSVAEIYHKVDL
jgi:Uma2 family endonuclease